MPPFFRLALPWISCSAGGLGQTKKKNQTKGSLPLSNSSCVCSLILP
nr:MAG TPA: hypothetical protein [Caudoviricetes sp.]